MRKWIDLIESTITRLPQAGCWIEPDGTVHQCDHDANIHHSDIALDHFDADNDAEDHAYSEGWIRVSAMDTISLSVDWEVSPTPQQKQALLKQLNSLKNYDFHNYYFAHDGMKTFGDFRSFRMALLQAMEP